MAPSPAAISLLRMQPRTLAALLLLLCVATAKASAKASAKPHIIHFMADDLGYNDLG